MMTASTQLSEGIILGRANFAELDKRGNKWKTRHVPVFIRTQLWRPYYLTEQNGESELYIIRPPDADHDKVHFVCWEPPST